MSYPQRASQHPDSSIPQLLSSGLLAGREGVRCRWSLSLPRQQFSYIPIVQPSAPLPHLTETRDIRPNKSPLSLIPLTVTPLGKSTRQFLTPPVPLFLLFFLQAEIGAAETSAVIQQLDICIEGWEQLVSSSPGLTRRISRGWPFSPLRIIRETVSGAGVPRYQPH